MRLSGWIAALAAAALSAPAAAQMSETETFIGAVRDRDGAKATELVDARGSVVLNGRNSKGETALLVAIGNRDQLWTRFLLHKGADPDLPDRSGETPLIAAARIGFADAVDWLLQRGAKVDGTNRLGETALIAAVQHRHAPVVRKLIAAGADPDKADAAAGYSAREYAERDTRSRTILGLLETPKPKAKAEKPDSMDSFKLD